MQNNPKCYELTLTPTYVSDWDYTDAMRELIQNGVDQETIDNLNKFKIEYDSDREVIRLISPKSKLSISTLLLGRTSKANNDATVGQFGEGYKIAALVLNRIGKTFTIYNNNAKQRWDSRFKNSQKWKDKILAFYVSEIEPIEQGLVIEVGNVSVDEYYELEDVWLGFYNYDDIDKIETSYGDILPGHGGEVYVAGLAINYYGDLQYGYNFKPQYIKLERDRKTCDSWNAKIITSKMISEALLNGKIKPEVVRKMIEEDCDDIYQMDIIENANIKELLIEEFDKNNKQPFSIPVGSEEQSKRVRSLGGYPVFVQHRVAQILSDETNKRIEELAAAPVSTGLSLYGRFKRWLAVYQDSLSKGAIEELEKLIDELE
jgi:hypothetical protein